MTHLRWMAAVGVIAALAACANNDEREAPPTPSPADRASSAVPPPSDDPRAVNPAPDTGPSLPSTPPTIPPAPGADQDKSMPPGPVNPR